MVCSSEEIYACERNGPPNGLKGWFVWSACLGGKFTGDPISLARDNIYCIFDHIDLLLNLEINFIIPVPMLLLFAASVAFMIWSIKQHKLTTCLTVSLILNSTPSCYEQ